MCRPPSVAAEVMAFAELLWVLPAGPVSRARITFLFCLCASLLLHGLLLVLATSVNVPRGEAGIGSSLPVLKLHLNVKAHHARATPDRSLPNVASVAVPRVQPVRAMPARSPLRLQKDVVAPPEPEPEPGAAMPFNLDDLRAQARSLAHSPQEQLVRGVAAHRNTSPVGTQDSFDRPILAALSRRLGKMPAVLSEQRMSDGSWMVRFAGNTCLRVPQHLPEWQKNPMGATVLVPMTCAD